MTFHAHITNINYETTFKKLLPFIKQKARETEDAVFAVRLIARLSSAAAGKALVGVMSCLDEADKSAVTCGLINSNSGLITEKINETLARKFPQIRTGGVSAGVSGSAVDLYAREVEVDLPALISDPFVADLVNEKARELLTEKLGAFAGMLAGKNTAELMRRLISLSPDAAQKVAVQVLNSGKYTSDIALIIENSICDWADITIGDLNIYETASQSSAALPLLPDFGEQVWEDKLLDAITCYIEKVTE